MDINIIFGGALLVLALFVFWLAARAADRAREDRAEAAEILNDARTLNENTKADLTSRVAKALGTHGGER